MANLASVSYFLEALELARMSIYNLGFVIFRALAFTCTGSSPGLMTGQRLGLASVLSGGDKRHSHGATGRVTTYIVFPSFFH